MPWRKRLLVVAVAACAVLPLAMAGARLRAGAPGEAGLWAAAFAAVTLALLHAFWPAFDLAGLTLRRGRGARLVALTFDDGPSDDTPAVLDALERARVAATFFVLGQAAERRPDLVREISRRGHAVALHGHTHARLVLAGPARVAEELDRCRDAIRSAGVEPAPWFRAPHGWKGPFLAPALRARGLALAAWTRGVWDTERPGAAVIAARASRRPRPGEILLLHDGCATPGIDPRRDRRRPPSPRSRGAGGKRASPSRPSTRSPRRGAGAVHRPAAPQRRTGGSRWTARPSRPARRAARAGRSASPGSSSPSRARRSPCAASTSRGPGRASPARARRSSAPRCSRTSGRSPRTRPGGARSCARRGCGSGTATPSPRWSPASPRGSCCPPAARTCCARTCSRGAPGRRPPRSSRRRRSTTSSGRRRSCWPRRRSRRR